MRYVQVCFSWWFFQRFVIHLILGLWWVLPQSYSVPLKVVVCLLLLIFLFFSYFSFLYYGVIRNPWRATRDKSFCSKTWLWWVLPRESWFISKLVHDGYFSEVVMQFIMSLWWVLRGELWDLSKYASHDDIFKSSWYISFGLYDGYCSIYEGVSFRLPIIVLVCLSPLIFLSFECVFLFD